MDLICQKKCVRIKPGDAFINLNVKVMLEPKVYTRLVGRLNYLTITKHDISFVVRVISQLLETMITYKLWGKHRLSWFSIGDPHHCCILLGSNLILRRVNN